MAGGVGYDAIPTFNVQIGEGPVVKCVEDTGANLSIGSRKLLEILPSNIAVRPLRNPICPVGADALQYASPLTHEAIIPLETANHASTERIYVRTLFFAADGFHSPRIALGVDVPLSHRRQLILTAPDSPRLHLSSSPPTDLPSSRPSTSVETTEITPVPPISLHSQPPQSLSNTRTSKAISQTVENTTQAPDDESVAGHPDPKIALHLAEAEEDFGDADGGHAYFEHPEDAIQANQDAVDALVQLTIDSLNDLGASDFIEEFVELITVDAAPVWSISQSDTPIDVDPAHIELITDDAEGNDHGNLPDVRYQQARPMAGRKKALAEGILNDLVTKNKWVHETDRPNWKPLAIAHFNIVEKKDGSGRPTTDARPANKLIRSVAYQAPNPENLINDILSDSPNFMFLTDIAGAFQALSITERSSRLCAVLTQQGVYFPRVLPQGLKCSPAIFQRAMEYVFKGIPRLAKYVDDFLGYGASIQSLLDVIRVTIKRCKEFNVKLNPKKTVMITDRVRFLGSVLHKGKKYFDPRRAEAFSTPNLGVPQSASDITSLFYSLHWSADQYIDFNHRFENLVRAKQLILQHAKLPKGQTQIKRVKLDAIGITQADCKKIHQEVTSGVLDAIQRTPFDPNLETHLFTDASDFAYAYVLTQLKEPSRAAIGEPADSFTGNDTPIHERTDHRIIACGSGAFAGAQSRYDIASKEFLAIRACAERWLWILEAANSVFIHCDNRAVVDMARREFPSDTGKLTVRRIERGLAAIGTVNYTIEHIPGSLNVLADYLSRQAVFSNEELAAGPVIRAAMISSTGINLPSSLADETNDPTMPGSDPAFEVSATEPVLYGQQGGMVIDWHPAWSNLDFDPSTLRVPSYDEQAKELFELQQYALTHDLLQPSEHTSTILGHDLFTDSERGRITLSSLGALRRHREQLEPSSPEFTLSTRALRIHIAILAHAHASPIFGHARQSLTIEHLRRHFSWPDLDGEAREFVRTCASCQIIGKQSKGPVPRPLGEAAIPKKRGDLVAMDFMTPESITDGKILTMVDALSGHVFLHVCRHETSEEVVRAMIQYVANFGPVKCWHTDNGSGFIAKATRDFLDKMGSDLKCSWAFVKRTLGTAERAHRTVRQALRFLLAYHNLSVHEWKRVASLAQMLVNSVPSDRLDGKTPFQVHLLKPRTFPQLVPDADPPADDDFVPPSPPAIADIERAWLEDYEANLAAIGSWEDAASAARKHRRDKNIEAHGRSHSVNFNTGDYVRRLRHGASSGVGPKMASWSDGVYVVTQVRPDNAPDSHLPNLIYTLRPVGEPDGREIEEHAAHLLEYKWAETFGDIDAPHVSEQFRRIVHQATAIKVSNIETDINDDDLWYAHVNYSDGTVEKELAESVDRHLLVAYLQSHPRSMLTEDFARVFQLDF